MTIVLQTAISGATVVSLGIALYQFGKWRGKLDEFKNNINIKADSNQKNIGELFGELEAGGIQRAGMKSDINSMKEDIKEIKKDVKELLRNGKDKA